MITSATNAKVKKLVALSQKAKVRKEEDAFIVEGPKMFVEAPFDWIREVYVAESFLTKCDFKDRLEKTGYEIVSDEVFKKISDTNTPQGILSVLKRPHYELEELLEKEAPFLMLLEDIQDPGNLGTILRTGEGAGIHGVIMTDKTADLFNPKVIRSTMGSIYRMPYYVTEDLLSVIDVLKQKGVAVYAAHLKDSVSYDEPDYTLGTAFLIGNEGKGLKDETANAATQYIKIPMAGQVESLNAAIASAILMYQAANQRIHKDIGGK